MATEDAPVILLAYNATERGGSPAKAQCDECRSNLRTKVRHVGEFRGVKPDSDVHRVYTHLRHYSPKLDIISIKAFYTGSCSDTEDKCQGWL